MQFFGRRYKFSTKGLQVLKILILLLNFSKIVLRSHSLHFLDKNFPARRRFFDYIQTARNSGWAIETTQLHGVLMNNYSAHPSVLSSVRLADIRPDDDEDYDSFIRFVCRRLATVAHSRRSSSARRFPSARLHSAGNERPRRAPHRSSVTA